MARRTGLQSVTDGLRVRCSNWLSGLVVGEFRVGIDDVFSTVQSFEGEESAGDVVSSNERE
jgi:hypothetical protein